MKSSKTIIAILFAVVVLASCESNHFFKSEKKLKGDIVGSWNRIPIASAEKDIIENWAFADGILTITIAHENDSIAYEDSVYYQDLNLFDSVDTSSVEKGTYTVDATVAAPFLKVEGLIGHASPFYNSNCGINCICSFLYR